MSNKIKEAAKKKAEEADQFIMNQKKGLDTSAEVQDPKPPEVKPEDKEKPLDTTPPPVQDPEKAASPDLIPDQTKVIDVPSPEPPADNKSAELQTKFDVLKGKYDKEVPRLSKDKRDLEEKVKALEALSLRKDIQIADLEMKLQDIQKKPEPQPEKSAFTDEEKAVLGNDLNPKSLEIIEAKIKSKDSETKKLLADKDAELEALRGQVGQVTHAQVRSSEEQFWSDMRKEIPNLELVDQQDGYDAFYQDNLESLETAYQKRDVRKAVRILTPFLKEHGLVEKPAASPVDITPAAPAQAPDTQKPTITPLADQVVPKNTRTVETTTKPEKTVTYEQVQKAIKKFEQRKISKTEMEQIYKDYHASLQREISRSA